MFCLGQLSTTIMGREQSCQEIVTYGKIHNSVGPSDRWVLVSLNLVHGVALSSAIAGARDKGLWPRSCTRFCTTRFLIFGLPRTNQLWEFEHCGLCGGVGRLSRLFKSRVLHNASAQGTKHHIFRIETRSTHRYCVDPPIFQKRVFFWVLRVGVEPELSTQERQLRVAHGSSTKDLSLPRAQFALLILQRIHQVIKRKDRHAFWCALFSVCSISGDRDQHICSLGRSCWLHHSNPSRSLSD